MKKGNTVVFKDALDHGDEKLIFSVIEIRGDKILVENINSGLFVNPQFVYHVNDLKCSTQ